MNRRSFIQSTILGVFALAVNPTYANQQLFTGVIASYRGAPVPTAPLRLISPYNSIQKNSGTAASGTQLVMRTRIPFYIGSGDASELVFCFDGWYAITSGAVDFPNAYSIVKFAIEKDGETASVPVTFSGSRTKTISPGDVCVQSDALLPSSFGISGFTRGDKYWMRLDISVASAGLYIPRGLRTYGQYGYPTSVGVSIDPAVFNGGEIDSYGTIGLGDAGGWSSFDYPYVPIVLGRFVTGDPKTIIGIGDSIIDGNHDSLTNSGSQGGFMQALFDADHVSNPLGGLNTGLSGAEGNAWAGTNPTYLTNYLQYAKYAVEAFGSNNFIGGSPPTDPATAESQVQAIWTLCATAGIEGIIRPHLIPRTAADGTTPATADWQSGGGAWAFDAWLDAASGFPAIVTVIDNDSLRVGTTKATTDYYSWTGGATNTAEGIHPNTAGAVLEAVDYRSAFDLLV